MSQRRGLGRGLGALIPSGGVATEDAPAQSVPTDPPVSERVVDLRGGAPTEYEVPADPGSGQLVYRELPLTDIVPNPRQPRQVFDDDALAELVHSITTVGLLQPIVVRPGETGFELVAGERRLRASRLAGLERIPALIRHTDDDAMLRDALLENLHRVQLNALEEAAAYSQLMTDFACTQEELAQRVGRSRPQVANTLRLLKLPPTVQRRVAAGVLSAGHARAILGAGDPDRMESLATRVVAEGLSVRAVEELVLVDQEGTRGRRSPRKPSGNRIPVEYQEAADRLGEHLETRVRIEGSKKGRLLIEFADVADLARIVEAILPPEPPRG